MISIDNSDVDGITIDGEQVIEITADGTTVWSISAATGLLTDFNDGDVSVDLRGWDGFDGDMRNYDFNGEPVGRILSTGGFNDSFLIPTKPVEYRHWEFDMYINNQTGNVDSRTPTLMFERGSDNFTSSLIEFSGDGQIRNNVGGNVSTIGRTWNEDQWYHIEYDFDFNSGTYNFTIDGDTYTLDYWNSPDTIGRVRFICDSEESGFTSIYWDNVRVTEY